MLDSGLMSSWFEFLIMLAQSSCLGRFLTIQNDFVGYLLLHIPTTSSLMSHRSLVKVDILTDHFFDSETTTALGTKFLAEDRSSSSGNSFKRLWTKYDIPPTTNFPKRWAISGRFPYLKAPLQVFRHRECHVICCAGCQELGVGG